MLVRQIVDSTLAQFAYLVGCPKTGEAIVIDPERDVDRYFEEAARHELRIVAAADTHIHADYLSGLREMADRGVLAYASREGGTEWQYEWLAGSKYRHRLIGHGDHFRVGFIEFRALHTPGHTPEHLSYLVRDAGAGATDPVALASGDFVFVGDVGRPDLLERAAGMAGMMVPSARAQFASIRRQFMPLPEYLQVWPAHGAGSACGRSLGDVPTSTVGYELRNNPSIRAATDEAAFVEFILAGQPEPPAYFARMKRENRMGPPLLGKLPKPKRMSPSDVADLISGSRLAVLDTRPRQAFFAGHIRNSILAELDFQLPAVAGSYVDETTPICLVVDDARINEAVRVLVRVGLDRIEGYVTPESLTEFNRTARTLISTGTIDMARLEETRRSGTGHVVDVRGRSEFEAGHVPGAINIPYTRIALEHRRLPVDRPLLVHCATGARAAAAFSALERLGYHGYVVDDDFSRYPADLAPVFSGGKVTAIG
jgi:hydroxyacylglutathione hydrolase